MNIKVWGRSINIGGTRKAIEALPSASYMVNPFYRHQGRLEPGQIIYVDNPSKFIMPDGGDNSEEYW